MPGNGLRSPGGLLAAAVLVVAGLWIAVLCVRSAVVRELSPNAPGIAQMWPHHPNVVLGKATVDIVTRHGILPAATLAAVRDAATRAPLDARAFLILGHQQLLDRQPQRAVATLEAGRHLDPRQRLIHLLLLDRYLRTERYDAAATEFSVLAKLVGSAQGPIAAAVAQMSKLPETRDATRRTLRSDPALENAVLTALARSDTDPVTIFDLASPVALAGARAPDSWGPALVNRLIEKARYDAARSVWQRVYGLSPAQVAAPLYDGKLQGLPGSAPFNWTLAAGSIGAADLRAGTLAIDYYGRDSGDLASQLLVLAPGSYRFAYTVEGGRSGAGSTLAWVLRCATGDKAVLMRAAVPAAPTRRQVAGAVTVPAGCPAQTLALIGEAGEFPTPINAVLRDLDLRRASAPATGPGKRP